MQSVSCNTATTDLLSSTASAPCLCNAEAAPLRTPSASSSPPLVADPSSSSCCPSAAAAIAASSGGHTIQLTCTVCNMPVSVPIEHSFHRPLHLVHHALSQSIDTLVKDIHALTSLAPDNHLDDLERRVDHLGQTVDAHCLLLEFVLNINSSSNSSALPFKQKQKSESLPSTPITPSPTHTPSLVQPPSPQTPPPSKRPRPTNALRHEQVKHTFTHVHTLLASLRSAPLSSMSTSIALALSHSRKPLDRHLLSTRSDGLACVRDAATALRFAVSSHFNEEQTAIKLKLKSSSAKQCISILVTFVNAVVNNRLLVNSLSAVSDEEISNLFHAISPSVLGNDNLNCANYKNTNTTNCANYSHNNSKNRNNNNTRPSNSPLPSQHTIHCQHAIISDDEFRRIAIAVAQILSTQRWDALCKQVPALNSVVMPSQKNPLVGILHMHKAIQAELRYLVAYCESIDPAHFKQMRNLSAKLQFLHRVHSCHAAGEEAILFKELQAKVNSKISNTAMQPDMLQEEHDDEELLFQRFAEKQAELETAARQSDGDPDTIRAIKRKLIESLRGVSNHISRHMQKEEDQLLPLVEKYFSVEDQDRMMRNVMAMVPSQLIEDIIPWMFNALEVNDREAMLRNLLQTTPSDEIRKVIGSIAKSVNKGLTQRAQWREICLRLPQIEEICEGLVDNEEEDEGPVSEIMRVHKVFRVELNAILEKSREIWADGTIPDPTKLVSLAQGVAFLWKMVTDHAKAEDDTILPRLEARVPGISKTYHNDHCDEQKLFQDLAKCLQDLQCVADEEECIGLVKKLHGLAETLRDEMVSHLEKEETHMWPVLKQHFTKEEQSEIVALIFGQMPAGRLRQFLPWMIRILSVAEGNTMMNHVMQITKSTLFEKWLKTWLPLPDQGADQQTGCSPDKPDSKVNTYPSEARTSSDSICPHDTHAATNPANMNSSHSPNTSSAPHNNARHAHNAQHGQSCCPTEQGNTNTNTSKGNEKEGGASTALAMLHCRETMEETIRSIARDASLSVQERTQMMQQVMLAPYNSHLRGSATPSNSSGIRPGSNSSNDSPPIINDENVVDPRTDRHQSFVVGADEKKHLGCRHYRRACKVRAACCGKLYTCRLCHDEAEKTHIMDRYATKEIVCMLCSTAQPVSRSCINKQCQKVFARYFCEVCKFYDDSPGRHIYHCHSCNVCRAGKGLGIDFFHCMTCNQCMSMKYRNTGHNCVHRAMESDCPVCHNFLFTSTQPVKYLRCGHLMHHECYVKFVHQNGVRCPVCSKSLEEMKDVYSKIDEQIATGGQLAMPSAYRGVICHIYCRDCQLRSTRSYHFIFNKCNLCNSYNTRVDHIDVNPTADPPSTHQ